MIDRIPQLVFTAKADRKVKQKDRPQITNSREAAEIARHFYTDDEIVTRESFFVICCNRNNRVTAYFPLSVGGVGATITDVKLVAKSALDSLAAVVVLVHNHPSGNLNPSQEDRKVTHNVKEALALFEIAVADHIILTEDEYLSFADNRIL